MTGPLLNHTASFRTLSLRTACVGALAALSVACGGSGGVADPGDGPPPAPVPNFVKLESVPGSGSSGTKSFAYTQANAVLIVAASSHDIGIRVDGDEDWQGQLTLPAGAVMKPGTYAGATNADDRPATVPGLSWLGVGGCGSANGSFTIDTVAFANGALSALDLRFEQRCDGSSTVFRGTVHWRADDPTSPPRPVVPIPADLWRPPAGAVPDTGSYVYMESDPGDDIGRGASVLYTPAETQIVVRWASDYILLIAGAGSARLVPMLSAMPAEVGYYGNLRGTYFEHNPVRGALVWGWAGRGCDEPSGWFAIDRITVSGSRIPVLELRFEQHCHGAAGATRVAVRWSE